jgi:serine protein kinase
MDATEFLDGAGARTREAWGRDLRLLTYDRFLALVLKDPYSLGRGAVQFAVDAVDHFGVRRVPGIGGTVVRHALFDAPFAGGRGAVHGQEAVQERLVRVLRSAAEEGRLDRLVVLHGPNGSCKSTLVECLMRGIAHYSRLPEGALYRFHWVFPRRGDEEEDLGFSAAARAPGGADRTSEKEHGSFALLEPEDIAARVPCEFRDNPLLLLPRDVRREVLAEGARACPPARSLRHLEDGHLCPKCRAIFDALLAGYHGDLRRVLRHAQVERWFVDPRFRSGAVVVPPQHAVDAEVHAVAHSSPAGSLPPLLHHVVLPEASGDLVDADRGVLEFSDFLKRPVDLWKYLLTTTEKGTVSVGPFLARMDLVTLATTNDKYLDAFKESPDWASFKARMELVAVPYLLEPSKEAAVYRDFLAALAPGRHVAPHVLDSLARFAVMTRLMKPMAESLPEEIRGAAGRLKPGEKLRLYETGETPEGIEESERRALLAAVPALRDEWRDAVDYEGRHGASAREIRSVLSAAAADPDGRDCLGTRVAFTHLRSLLREKTVYEFLRIEPEGGFHDADAFADEAELQGLRRSLEDLQEALELVPPGEYRRRFERYVAHALASTQREKVRNPHTGAQEAPDEEVMTAVERLLGLKDSAAAFRRNLVSRIGAFGVENPGKKPDLGLLFPEILRALRGEYFAGMREKVRKVEAHILAFGTPEFDRLDRAQQDLVRRALDNLEKKFGYCRHCAREAVVAVKRLLEE